MKKALVYLVVKDTQENKFSLLQSFQNIPKLIAMLTITHKAVLMTNWKSDLNIPECIMGYMVQRGIIAPFIKPTGEQLKQRSYPQMRW